MKDWKLSIPLSLFIIYIITCLFRTPTLSDSLVALTLASLYAFSLWIVTTKIIINKPIDAETEKQLRILDGLRLQREINALQLDINRIATQQKSGISDVKKPYSF